MEKKIASLMILALFWGSGTGRADFKYSESIKMNAFRLYFLAAFRHDAAHRDRALTNSHKSNRPLLPRGGRGSRPRKYPHAFGASREGEGSSRQSGG